MKWNDPNDDVEQQPDGLRFLAARMHAEQFQPREPDRCWGISSDALALFGVGGRTEPTRWRYPADRWDLRACERTYLMAPDDVRAVMLPVLEKYRTYVAERWPEKAAS